MQDRTEEPNYSLFLAKIKLQILNFGWKLSKIEVSALYQEIMGGGENWQILLCLPVAFSCATFT